MLPLAAELLAESAMAWDDTWAETARWFGQLSSDEAYTWARFFPAFLEDVGGRPSAAGLYAHRWALTVVVSRFGAVDYQAGPKLELMALPGRKVQIQVYESFNRRLTRRVLELSEIERLDEYCRFVAGECPGDGELKDGAREDGGRDAGRPTRSRRG